MQSIEILLEKNALNYFVDNFSSDLSYCRK